jgi:peptidoglycan lytic transglycosylase
MDPRRMIPGVLLLGVLASAPVSARAQNFGCEDHIRLDDEAMACFRYGPDAPPPPVMKPDPLRLRVLSYAALKLKYKLAGLASYYSTSLDGTLTATGEIFRNKRFTAAHLKLPLGTWVEVQSRATGRKIRCLVNDRGPYAKKFVLDLSQAAARALGVDVADDRYVDIRVIALPGEQPLPENWEMAATSADSSPATAVVAVTSAE